MEAYFHLAVRIIAAAYILYRVWVILFRQKLFGLWDRIPVKERKPVREKTTAPALETVKRGEVVGRTHKVVLDDPRKTEPKPVASTDLEPTGFIGQDEPIEPDEVKEEYRPSDEELYDQDASPDEDGDFSSGVTIEELSEATDVIQNGPKDELALLKAAKTVYDAQDTEIFDHFANMASKKIALDELLRQGLDEHGVPRWRKSRRYLEFDMDMMV